MKRLYAIFSMATPSTVHTMTAASIATAGEVDAEDTAVKMTNPPIMMTSPCAKFNIFAIPYTIVYPSAISAYTLPRLMPLIRYDKKFIKLPS